MNKPIEINGNSVEEKMPDIEKEKLKFLLEEVKIQKSEINIYLTAQIQLMNITLVAIGATLTAIEKLSAFSIHISGISGLGFIAIYLSQLRYTNTIRYLSSHIIRRLQPAIFDIIKQSKSNNYVPMSWENEGSFHFYRPNDSFLGKILNYSVQQMRSFIALAAGVMCTTFLQINTKFIFSIERIDIPLTVLAMADFFAFVLALHYTYISLNTVISNPTNTEIFSLLKLSEIK